jgi:hypothetical protein
MQLFAFTILFLCHSFAIATANGENQISNLSNQRSPRNVPYDGLAQLEKRVTTIPNLVPTTTVKLSTDSTGTTQIVSPNRAGETSSTTNAFAVPTGQSTSSVTTAADSSRTQEMGHHRATATSSSIATGSSNGSPAAQSTSSKGGASNSNAVPLAGMLLLGLLGL